MSKYILLLFITFKGINTNAQSVTLFKDAKGRLFTQQQLDSVVAARNEKLKSLDMTASSAVTGKEQNGDTTFYLFTINVSNAGVQKNDEKKNRLINSVLPSFNFISFDGKAVSTESLKGKPVIINMWFTTCPPCIAEMPELNRMKEKYSATDIVFLSMTYEPTDKVAAFLKKHQFDYTHIPAVTAYCKQFTDNYPISIFVDRNGTIKDIQNGMPILYDRQTRELTNKVNSEEFERTLKSIL
ncbi:MAG: TlpA disulfide reductase family protein [Chitinophagaceae bacterium]